MLAILIVLAVVYKIAIAPRSLEAADAYPAPRVTYAALSGAPFVLAQHRGRVVFLDFWASWCEPCKAQMPLVESFARNHPAVDVIPVDVGEPPSVAAAYARGHGLSRVALDPKALSAGFFQINGFPTMVVIDPQGRIRATWTGFNPAVELNMGHAERSLSTRPAS
ncbi:MAG: TlpA family protein disulfide reductase [Candidatus Eremiobacteraeota bacterium]|nr:TlpA family protein disulfide reductase [Candidatus Eremiobacteraeota bacterium]